MSATTDSGSAGISYFSLTAGGALLALKLRDRFGGTAHLPRCHSLGCERCNPFDSIAEALPERFREGDTLVCVMASGIVFRLLAPHLRSKQEDPAVIVVDEDGRFAIPLLGGHAAGANRLAEAIARFLGGEAAITTSSDVQGLTAPDEVARLLGACPVDIEELRRVTALLVNGGEVCIEAESDPGIEGYRWVRPGGPVDGSAGRLLVSHKVTGASAGDGIPTAKLVPRMVAAGIGCRRGTPAEAIVEAVEAACGRCGIEPMAVGRLASVELKSDEPGLAGAAAALGASLAFYPAIELKSLGIAGSDFVEERTGTPAVSEPAALLAAGEGAGTIMGKTSFGPVTVALALGRESLSRPGGGGGGEVAVVGIGAGTGDLLTGEAAAALREANVIIGYRTYIEQVKKLYPGQEFISGSMGAELERCHQALELARSGKRVAMVSSGDPGVYGMAGPLIEEAGGTPVRILPGVTAAQIAAARLGAPLMNDYVTLSLSDLLTPRDEVLRRVAAAAASDLVICLYNPTSRKRRPLFEEACGVIAAYRPAGTIVGMVRNAGAGDEEVSIFSLAELPGRDVDMRSLIIIGNSKTTVTGGRLVTTRGYESKKAGKTGKWDSRA